MQNHSMLILCDVCSVAVPDQAAKEVFYRVDKVRYRLELCTSCLNAEMKRLDGHRSIPGFRKRGAILYSIPTVEALPVDVGVVSEVSRPA